MLAKLRALIEKSNDPIVVRIAQAEETAIRWVTEETADWDEPDQDVLRMAEILRNEL